MPAGGPGVERALKWLLPVLIVTEIILVRGGVLTAAQAVLVVVLIEGLLVVVAARQAVVAARRYRAGRREGADPWTAAEDALTVFLPRRVARFVLLEPRMWVCLWRWAIRRYRAGPDDFPYHARSWVGIFLIVLLFTTPVEILLLEVLIPWAWLRWVVLVLAVYSLVWMFGLYASLVVLPHRLEADGLRLRYGLLNWAFIPFEIIEQVHQVRRTTPGGREGLRISDSVPATAYLGIGGRTDITIELCQPVRFWSLSGLSRPVRIIHFAADQPDRLVAALRERVARTARSLTGSATS